MRQKIHTSGSDFATQDAQLIQIVDAALADAAQRAGNHLACRPGCTQCCHGAFAINALDALRLRSAMAELRTTDPTLAQRLESRAQKYLAQYGNSFPGNPATGILDTTPEAEEAFESFANEAPCPALDPATGHCDLYEARPMACRIFGPPVRMDLDLEIEGVAEPSFAVCELCFTEATPQQIQICEMQVPHHEEQSLLKDLAESAPQNSLSQGVTLVAFCLLA